jgi:hypothetical protein
MMRSLPTCKITNGLLGEVVPFGNGGRKKAAAGRREMLNAFLEPTTEDAAGKDPLLMLPGVFA